MTIRPNLRYPVTRTEPTVDVLHGRPVPDPYRWLEAEDDEVHAWQAAQRQIAVNHLHGLPAFEEARAQVAALIPPSADRGTSPPVDLEELAAGTGATLAIDWRHPSPDGRFTVLGISEDGSERSTLHLVEVATGDVVLTHPHAERAQVAWLPDSSGFYFNAGLVPDTEDVQRHIFSYHLGDAKVVGPYDLDHRHCRWVAPQVSATHTAVLCYVEDFLPRPWYLRRHGDERWTPFLRDVEGDFRGFLHSDRYVAVTHRDAPRGRVVAVPLGTPEDESTWVELVPESDVVIRDVFPAGRDVLVEGLLDVRPHLQVVAPDGEVVARADGLERGAAIVGSPWQVHPLLNPVSTGDTPDSERRASVRFGFQSVNRSFAPRELDLATGAVTDVEPPRFHDDGVELRLEWAASADGTRVPLTVACLGADAPTGPRPTVISAYAGFNVPHLPTFAPWSLAFIRAGGVVVYAHARGGGELGEPWWRDARRAAKQHSYDDIYATAEHLIATGVTEAGRVGIVGGSNGGLLVSIALVQRPDLWGAGVARVPVTDLVRLPVTPWAHLRASSDFGVPDEPEELGWLLAISPYHNVEDGVAYPPLLIEAAAQDSRALPFHARKLAARIQAASSGDAPILLNVQPGSGHMVATSPSAIADGQARVLAFLSHHLGLRVPHRAGAASA